MRRVTLLLIVVSLFVGTANLGASPQAIAEVGPDCWEVKDRGTGTVTIQCRDKQEDGSGDSSADVKVPPRTCYDPATHDVIDCETDNGWWHAVYKCYIKPAPDRDDEWLCTDLNGDTGSIHQLDGPEPPPDPRQVAWELIAQIQLRAGQIAFAPDPEHGLIGLPHWMWIPDRNPQTTGPITQSATKNGYTITIDAVLDRVVYDMGNGDTVTCTGEAAQGTRYLERYKLNPSPTCGYDTGYAEPGAYTITAQSFWVINWYGVGQAGTITLDFTRSAETTIAEQVSVNR